MVKFPVLGAGDVGNQPVKNPATLLIIIQAVIKQVAQEAAALRRAEAVSKLKGTGTGVSLICRTVAEE